MWGTQNSPWPLVLAAGLSISPVFCRICKKLGRRPPLPAPATKQPGMRDKELPFIHRISRNSSGAESDVTQTPARWSDVHINIQDNNYINDLYPQRTTILQTKNTMRILHIIVMVSIGFEEQYIDIKLPMQHLLYNKHGLMIISWNTFSNIYNF